MLLGHRELAASIESREGRGKSGKIEKGKDRLWDLHCYVS